MCLCKEALSGFKNQDEEKFPNIVNVCVLKGSCPCKCVHCPVGSQPYHKRKSIFGSEIMSFETFKKIADEVAKYPHSSIRIHSVGEPLLWPHLEEALAYTKAKNIKTWLFTSLVTKDKYALFCIANSSAIVEVSINSIDPKNYSNTKGINSFNDVKKNLKYVSNIIKSYSLDTRLIVSRVQSSDTKYDSKFVGFWKKTKLVEDAFIRSYHDYNGLINNRGIDSIRGAVPCIVHWARFSIDCNGNALVCFNELFRKYDDSLVLGNINDNLITEIWHGEKLNSIRNAQMKNDYGLIHFTKNLPCKNCRFCQPLNTERVTSEYQLKKIAVVRQ
jgi:MoaA/NifB/PqqE/SkfB family radical SAM enzyme